MPDDRKASELLAEMREERLTFGSACPECGGKIITMKRDWNPFWNNEFSVFRTSVPVSGLIAICVNAHKTMVDA